MGKMTLHNCNLPQGMRCRPARSPSRPLQKWIEQEETSTHCCPCCAVKWVVTKMIWPFCAEKHSIMMRCRSLPWSLGVRHFFVKTSTSISNLLIRTVTYFNKEVLYKIVNLLIVFANTNNN